MLRCRDVVDLLARYLDGELEPCTAVALERHLADCQPCTAFLNTYRGAVRAVRQLRDDQLPAELRDRLLAFLRQGRRS